jgi:hypothetical protein
MRGLWVKTWIASHPIAAPLSTAFQMPPADETWAPKSIDVRYPPVFLPLRDRLGPLAERDFRLLFSATTAVNATCVLAIASPPSVRAIRAPGPTTMAAG